MSQDNLIKLQCTVCKHINYYSTRNKKTVKAKLQLKKHCKWCRWWPLDRDRATRAFQDAFPDTPVRPCVHPGPAGWTGGVARAGVKALGRVPISGCHLGAGVLDFGVTAEGCLGSASAVTVSSWSRRLSFWLLALLLLSAGTTHFLHPEVFIPIVPPAVPWPLAAGYVSGLAELGLGLALLVPRLSRGAARGVCVFLMAVFPANVHHWLSGMALGGTPAPGW